MIAEIFELRDILKQKSRLAERERRLCTPVLCDQGLIPRIYEWFCEMQCGGEEVYCRRQFILIVLFLYAPAALAGGRMPRGLRRSIASAAGFADVTFVSHNVDTVFFYYRHYEGFRKEVDGLYAAICGRLGLGSF